MTTLRFADPGGFVREPVQTHPEQGHHMGPATEPGLEEAALGVVASFTRDEPESMKVTAIEQLLTVCNSLGD